MDFDYYQIRGKWNAATLNRRAEKLEEAQAAAEKLEEAGAKGVEIIGVKAGKRETIRGKKKAPKAAKSPKAAKVQATKKKAYTVPKMKVKAQEKPKPKKAATKVEPAGQLDLFAIDENKNKSFLFSPRELEAIFSALSSYGRGGLSSIYYKELLNCFERASLRGSDIQITLNGRELIHIYSALQKRLKDERDPMHNIFLNLVRDLNV